MKGESAENKYEYKIYTSEEHTVLCLSEMDPVQKTWICNQQESALSAFPEFPFADASILSTKRKNQYVRFVACEI